MTWQSALAIFVLFWVLAAFVVMPFGVRTHDEAGVPRVPGQAESAPHEFRPWRIVGWTTLIATLAWGLFVANYSYGWLTPAMLDVFTPETWRGR